MWNWPNHPKFVTPEVLVAVIQDATDSFLSQKEGDPEVSERPTHHRDSREFLSKLVAAPRQSVHQGIPVEFDSDTPPVALPEVGALLRHTGSQETKTYF